MDPTSPTAAIGGAAAGAQPARPVENPGALLDRDAFLKLLVAQLKYQDPSKPADASQMLAQSAQLTMVDRLNDIVESLDASAASTRLSLAGSLVGKDVTFLDEEGATQSGRVSSVRVDGDEISLLAGNYSVPLGALTSVDAANTVFAPAELY